MHEATFSKIFGSIIILGGIALIGAILISFWYGPNGQNTKADQITSLEEEWFAKENAKNKERSEFLEKLRRDAKIKWVAYEIRGNTIHIDADGGQLVKEFREFVNLHLPDQEWRLKGYPPNDQLISDEQKFKARKLGFDAIEISKKDSNERIELGSDR